MEPIKALQMLYGATQNMNLTANEHKALESAAMKLDAYITSTARTLDAVQKESAAPLKAVKPDELKKAEAGAK